MSEPLRFAMVTTFYPPYHFGGDGTLIRTLTHALVRRGHQVDVIHDVDAYRMLNQGSEPLPLTEPEGVRVYPLQSRLGSISCLATQQLGRPLVHGREIRRILSQGYDVIHYHNVSLVGGPGILSYGQAIKLYTTHEHWLVCPTHILWRHQREPCDRRECLRCVVRHRRPPQLWRYTNYLQSQAKHVDAFLAPSQFSADKHREFGFRDEMSVLPNFLPDMEQDVADGIADPPFFLFVGRLELIKGLQDVIPLIDDDFPAELWIAGTGNDEQRLRELAVNRNRIRFLGQQSHEQLRRLYRQARAVITPSRCYEVFPMVVLEAFREGTPIIARDLGPYPEVISQSQGGLLFKDQEQLKTCLERLASDDQLRDTLGQAGRRAFLERWTETVVLERYLDLINQLSHERRKQPSRS